MLRNTLVPAVMLAVLAAFPMQTAEGASSLDAATMKAALQTATPEENGFIQHVLDLVHSGTLPESLVMSTFIWARKKPQQRFQYFKYGLVALARRRGIAL